MVEKEQEVAPALPDWRNPTYNARGTVDLEINVDGIWLPFTADPNDVEEHGRSLYAAAIAAGSIAAFVPPTAEQARAAMPDLSRKQFRLGMRDLGVTTAMIDTALAAIPDEDQRETAQIEWEDSDSYSRMHPLISQLATAFGKSDAEIDAEWVKALGYN